MLSTHDPNDDGTLDENRDHRAELVFSREFEANSLVGSFFHADAGRGWQGYVVAEPHPGYYLVETLDWIEGAPHDQALVHIAAMSDWVFYDTSAWMRSHTERVEQRWKRERKEGAA